ncbi:UDP-glycosyltransferase 83A1-like [Prosopis cineraria]|uniref:UDP-glycosyltransferase 83A1-like n=1 Tax=Prosopis cineraria TaxID=364024 RepID=UPI00240F7595|nr:UDP-glycosyltransferase 83A1-like [Prosopis cineraria]
MNLSLQHFLSPKILPLQELAVGLELSNKPFLWAVRSDINKAANYDFLKEFEERLSSQGKVIGWAPQQKVLNHRSIACFLSHCAWNSTLEGVINGVPFFADQYIDEAYICDIWKVGLRLGRNDGVISREEVASKINQVFHDEEFRARALELKEKAISSVKAKKVTAQTRI